MRPTTFHHPMLQCGLDDLAVDRECHTARVDIPALHATDMTGCIRLVREHDPLVRQIDVYSGRELDVIYHKDSGVWRAYLPALNGQPARVGPPVRVNFTKMQAHA